LSCLEHAVDSLVGRIAAGLRGISSGQRLIGGALSTRAHLSGFAGLALSICGCALRAFCDTPHGVEVFLSNLSCASNR
jgi:hypothetical protein